MGILVLLIMQNHKVIFKLIDKKIGISQNLKLNKQEKSDEFSGWYYGNPIHSELYKVPDTTYIQTL